VNSITFALILTKFFGGIKPKRIEALLELEINLIKNLSVGLFHQNLRNPPGRISHNGGTFFFVGPCFFEFGEFIGVPNVEGASKDPLLNIPADD
jgi:hypothetical protein